MFTRWEVPDPTTIENRAAVSAAAINHTSINHCHLAPRQPHTSLCGAPACSSQECWVMRDGKGASRHPITSHVGKKGKMCHVRVCEPVYIDSANRVLRRLLSPGGKAGWTSRITSIARRGEVAARRWCMREVHDGKEFRIIVDMFDDQSLKHHSDTFLSPVNQAGSWTLQAFTLTLTVW